MTVTRQIIAQVSDETAQRAPRLLDRLRGAKADWRRNLPFLLLGGLLLSALITIFVRVNEYGISLDEPLRDATLVGVALGVASAVRVNAVIWWAILAVLLAG